jgi:Fe2+ or Zn2+ uptake regulation protein
MASKKYPSKYSNGKTISPAQYITEIICEKKAKIDKKDLHYRFWLNPIWEKFYKDQIASAYKLLKKYSDTAIIKALNSAKAEKIYSLRAPHLIPIIEQEQVACEQKNNELSIQLSRPKNVLFRNTKTDKNIISKLKDLDNES